VEISRALKTHIGSAKYAISRARPLERMAALAVLLLMLVSIKSPAIADPTITVTLSATGTQVHLTRDTLQDLPMTTYTTSTVWTDTVDTYAGVLLYDVLKTLSVDMAAQNGQIVFKAADDYQVILRFVDIDKTAPMIAFLRNDAVIPPRTQGPFWLIWPYDLSSHYRTETIYAHSIWHIVSMDIEF